MDEFNVHRCDLYKFEDTKKSLIGYQNKDQDELFRYYDNRNKTRLNKLLNKAGITKDLTQTLKEMGSSVLSILKKLRDKGTLRGQHEAAMRDLELSYDDAMEWNRTQKIKQELAEEAQKI